MANELTSRSHMQEPYSPSPEKTRSDSESDADSPRNSRFRFQLTYYMPPEPQVVLPQPFPIYF
jgi:hypothetical protein